jgi:NAD(P)-dependent dehydrogenase (short-subunit alcohol dehydrogenase family)
MCILEADFEREIQPTIEINLLGTMRVNHVFADHVIDSSGTNMLCVCAFDCAGAFVQMASVAGYVGFQTHYSASKHAICGYNKALRIELASTNVNVVGILPGIVDTPMTQSIMKREVDFSQTRLTKR